MSQIHVVVDKIRHLIRHIDPSPSRIQAFNGIVARFGLPTKSGFILDVPNRWNSTFQMIGQALQYKGALNRCALEKLEPCPDEEDWENVEAILVFLKAFEEATRAVSADRKPTSHIFMHIVLCISHAFSDQNWQINDSLKELASAMHKKFLKYWDNNYNISLVIDTILDPSKKLDYLDFFYEKICLNLDEVDSKVDLAKDWMKRYFQEYENVVKRSTEHSVPRTIDARQIGSPILGKIQPEEEFARYRSHRRGRREPKSELDIYLEDEFERSKDFDILLWWKRHAEKYHILSRMARDFLAIPLSTVSSESAFSCGERILGDSRSSLSCEMVEALVCGKDWLTKIAIIEDDNEA